MKTKFKFIMTAILMLAVMPLSAMQEAPTGFAGAIQIITGAFTSAAVLAAAILPLTEWAKSILKSNGTIAKVFSWSFGLVLAIIGKIFHLGVFAEADWLWTIIIAAVATFAANGLFSYDFIKIILDFLTPRFHKVSKSE